MDPHIFATTKGLEWQAELLGHASGHFFAPGYVDMRMAPDALHAFMGASCEVLRFKTAENAAQTEVKMLNSEINVLRSIERCPNLGCELVILVTVMQQ